jgi:hypothetical protein
MGTRDVMEELLDGLIDFGSIEGTALGDSDGIEATIRGADDGQAPEEASGCELWGAAPLQYRPLAGTEVVLLRRGDEIVGLATKDRRVAVAIEEGEVVVTNLSSSSPARIRMLASGEVLIEASKVGVVALDGSISDAAEALAKASAVEDALTTLKNAINSAVVASGDGGATFKTNIITALTTPPWPPSVGSARIFSED